MGKTSEISLLFIVCIFTISNITSPIPLVSAQLTYQGHSKTSYPPYFEFSLENGTTLYDLGNYNIAFRAGVGGPANSITFGGAIYSLSYKASWENKTTIIHEWSINDPADLEDDDPNPMAAIFYAIDLTNVPQGSHQIEITVEGGGYVGFYQTYSSTGSTTFHFSIIAPPYPAPSPTPINSLPTWNVQTIDDRGAGGFYTSPLIALDTNNTPHIAYSWQDISTPPRWLTYASWNNFSWNLQTIDVFGPPNSLIIDNKNKPHLVYGSMKYATLEGSNWMTQTIDEGGSGVVAVDTLDKPHIAYTDGKTVKYAIQTESGWAIQTIDTIDLEYKIPFQVSLAIDKNNIPHILYVYPSYYEDKITGENRTTKTIKLAVYENSNWNIKTILLPHPINGYGNMVLDSKGYPHFICSQAQIQSTSPYLSNLLHVSWDGKSWNVQNVATDISLGIYGPNVNYANIGSIALDSNDYPRIVYTTSPEPTSYFINQLTYASWDGNSWNIYTVDANVEENRPGFLALDSNNNPHIVYFGNMGPAMYTGNSVGNVTYATSIEVSGIAELEIIPILIVVSIAIIVVFVGTSLLLNKKHKNSLQ